MDELIEVGNAPVEDTGCEIIGQMSGDMCTRDANLELNLFINRFMGSMSSAEVPDDWISEIVHAYCTQEVIDGYDRFIKSPVRYKFRDVIGSPYGPVHLSSEGLTNRVYEIKGLAKILRQRPVAVESVLQAYFSYRSFMLFFLRDIERDTPFVKDSEMIRIYRDYRSKCTFVVVTALIELKRLVDGSKYDYDERLPTLPCTIVSRKGMTDLRLGETSLVSCSASKYSNILIWIIFIAWYDIVMAPNPDVQGPPLVQTLKKRSELRFNPMAVFKILRFRMTGV